MEDYNAHVKINGEDGKWPDRGVIEGNTFIDTVPRITAVPITPVDLVGASDWRVSGNFVADFVRGMPGEATYGGFFKGTGQNNVFERNLVLCEWKLRDVPGQHVGLSLGGGSTDIPLRRDKGATGMEQVGGIIRNNLIAFCSDDGIYLNRSARSLVDHNTLLDTAGIDGRFVETSGTVTANIVDGAVRARDGAVLEGWDNDKPFVLDLFAGWHPQRGYFRDPARLDMTWKSVPDRIAVPDNVGTDLCGAQRGATAPAGAFDDYRACLRNQQ
jgi:parallel beta-helix repeat protein